MQKPLDGVYRREMHEVAAEVAASRQTDLRGGKHSSESAFSLIPCVNLV